MRIGASTLIICFVSIKLITQSAQFVWCAIIQITKQSYLAGPSSRAVCGCSPAEIVGSNPTGGMDVCLLWVLCVVR